MASVWDNPRFIERARIAGIFLLAFAVRWLALHLTFPDGFVFGKYLTLGQELFDNGFVADRPFSYSPLYCYFIALLRAPFGDALYPKLIVQAGLGAASCVLLYLIATPIVGHRWALVPAAIASVYRSFVLYEVTFLSDFLGLFLQLALVVWLERIGERGRRRHFLIAGALIGLSILYRPNNLLLLPLLAVVLLAKQTPPRRLIGQLGAALLGAALLTAPVAVQNFRLTGAPGITASNPGYIFYSSNNASCYGFRYSPPSLYSKGSDFYGSRARVAADGRERFIGDAEIAAIISGAINGAPASLGESSRYYLGFTLAHMVRYPAHYVGLLAVKLQLAFNAIEPHDIAPVFAREAKIGFAAPVPYGLVAPLGLFGLLLSLRRWRAHLWLYMILANQLVLLVAFYVVVRFRLPVEAMLILFCGVGIRALADWVKAGAVKPLLASGLVLVLLAGVVHVETPAVAERATTKDLDHLLSVAKHQLGRGKLEAARIVLEGIVDTDQEYLPRAFEARELLHRVRRQTGAAGSAASPPPPRWDPETAIEALELRRAADTLTFQELRLLGQLHLSTARWQRGRDVVLEALGRRPFDPVIRYDLARALLFLGEPEQAKTHLLLSVDDGLLFTEHGMYGSYFLAQVFEQRGDTERQEVWMKQAGRQSVLTRWYPDDEIAAELASRLRMSHPPDPGEPERLIRW